LWGEGEGAASQWDCTSGAGGGPLRLRGLWPHHTVGPRPRLQPRWHHLRAPLPALGCRDRGTVSWAVAGASPAVTAAPLCQLCRRPVASVSPARETPFFAKDLCGIFPFCFILKFPHRLKYSKMQTLVLL